MISSDNHIIFFWYILEGVPGSEDHDSHVPGSEDHDSHVPGSGVPCTAGVCRTGPALLASPGSTLQ